VVALLFNDQPLSLSPPCMHCRVTVYTITQVKKELKKLDKEHVAETGVKSSCFVDSYEEVVGWLQLLERPKPGNQCINTYDFSTMYTTPDLSDLVVVSVEL